MKVIIIGGRARNGKTTTAEFIKEYLEANGKKAVVTNLAKYVKMYAKEVDNYNENKDEKSRNLLQLIGKQVREIDELFLLKRFSEDYLIYKKYTNYCIIDGIRMGKEVDYLKGKYDAFSIKVIRTNFDDGLTEEQRNDITETGLDSYKNFDKIIINDASLNDLKEKIIKLLEEIQ